jgi:two-component system chemotaxis response regulator CheY
MALSQLDMKILVVDDFATMRRITKTLLRQIGYSHFVEAKDGVEALALLGQGETVDLVIATWAAPNMSGLDFLKAVRADAKLRHLPFLMLAGDAEKDQMPTAMSAGANGYVVKPFTGQMLAEKLTRICSQPPVRQAS